jgi:hypothetical protein
MAHTEDTQTLGATELNLVARGKYIPCVAIYRTANFKAGQCPQSPPPAPKIEKDLNQRGFPEGGAKLSSPLRQPPCVVTPENHRAKFSVYQKTYCHLQRKF